MSFHDRNKIVPDGGAAVVVEQQPSESPVQTVIRGITAAEETPQDDLDPLYDSIEPEALNELIQHSQSAAEDLSVVFTYEGFTILVEDEGLVKIMDSPPGKSGEML